MSNSLSDRPAAIAVGRAVVRTLLEIAIVVVAVFIFVAPAFRIEYRGADPTDQPVSVLALTIPDSTGVVDLDLGLHSGPPVHGSSTTTVTISLSLNQDKPPVRMPYVVFGGTLAAGFDTCAESQVQLNQSAKFDELDQSARAVVNGQWLQSIQAKHKLGEVDDYSKDEQSAAKSERSTEYVIATLNLTPQPNEGIPLQAVYADCTFQSSAFWRSNGPDRLFDLPESSIAYGHTLDSAVKHSFSDGNFAYSVSVMRSSDYSVVGISQNGATNKSTIDWSSGDICDAKTSPSLPVTARRDCDAVSGTLRSEAANRHDQQALFVAGIALGIAGGVAANAIRSLFDGLVFGGFSIWRGRQRAKVNNGLDSSASGSAPTPSVDKPGPDDES